MNGSVGISALGRTNAPLFTIPGALNRRYGLRNLRSLDSVPTIFISPIKGSKARIPRREHVSIREVSSNADETIARENVALPAPSNNGVMALTEVSVNVTSSPPPVPYEMNGADLETWVDPCTAGQVETCAALRANQENEIVDNALEDKWSRRKSYKSWQRTLEIWSFAFSFFFKLWWTSSKLGYPRNGFTPEAISEKKKQLATWLRSELIRLGPTFIKIGQQFSTRVDVLSQEFIKELEQLQDNVPPFDSQIAVQIVEESYGKKLTDTFESFTKTPIAAASLGQVHMARIKGETVVVKVQRPGLKALFDIDLKNIRVLAQILQKMDPKSDGAARDWVAIYDECSRILYEEIDYLKEAANADKFKRNFSEVEWVKVPNIFWEYTTSEVLVMEYCPGTKINNRARIDELGMNCQQLARYAVESYLQQILRHGFFHADPHPGNVSVDTVNGGRLIYYDFGMMGTIPGNVKDGLVELFYGVYKRDIEKCVEALMEMGVLVRGGDMTAIRRTGEFILSSFKERLDEQRAQREANPEEYSQTFKAKRTKDETKQLRKKILANIGEDLLVTAADQPFRFPAEFTFVVRAFSVLDGIGKSLDNRFDISEIAAPYARDFVLEGRPQIKKFQEEFGIRAELQKRAFVNLFKGPNMIEDINTMINRLERGDLKLRVRALEAERALTRVETWQSVMATGLLASTMINVGTMLRVNSFPLPSTAAFVLALIFAFLCLSSFLKVKTLEKKEKQITGVAIP